MKGRSIALPRNSVPSLLGSWTLSPYCKNLVINDIFIFVVRVDLGYGTMKFYFFLAPSLAIMKLSVWKITMFLGRSLMMSMSIWDMTGLTYALRYSWIYFSVSIFLNIEIPSLFNFHLHCFHLNVLFFFHFFPEVSSGILRNN